MLRNVMVAVKPPNTPTMLRCQQISGGGWRPPTQEQASTSSREFMFAWAIFGGSILEDMLLLLLFLCGPSVVRRHPHVNWQLLIKPVGRTIT